MEKNHSCCIMLLRSCCNMSVGGGGVCLCIACLDLKVQPPVFCVKVPRAKMATVPKMKFRGSAFEFGGVPKLDGDALLSASAVHLQPPMRPRSLGRRSEQTKQNKRKRNQTMMKWKSEKRRPYIIVVFNLHSFGCFSAASFR